MAGATAHAVAELIGIQANIAIRFFCNLRKLIAGQLPSYEFSGEVETDESYFGGTRKGKHGRSTAGKMAVFGLLKRKETVYTAVIPNAKTEMALPIIKEKARPDSIVYTDTNFHHARINHSEHFAKHYTISMTSKTSGTKPNVIYGVLTASKRNILTGF